MNVKTRILLVDAYAVVRSGLMALLDGEPDMVVVGQAGDAETAVFLTNDLQPDLIILDLQLPDFDGLDLIKAVRLNHPQTRMLVLSNNADPQRIHKALAVGVDGYWLKDNNSRQIVTVIRQVMTGQQMLHPLLVKLRTPGQKPAASDAGRRLEI